MVEETIGQTIKRYREEAGMTASELAAKTGLSKSYISELESTLTTARGPSAAVLYEIAKALGVAIADLLGKPVLVSRQPNATVKRSSSLDEFGKRFDVPESDLRMLEQIQFRGEVPQTSEAWYVIYQAIKHNTGS
jgi:transcriptional regulator with XRE-family HTH domain